MPPLSPVKAQARSRGDAVTVRKALLQNALRTDSTNRSEWRSPEALLIPEKDSGFRFLLGSRAKEQIIPTLVKMERKTL